MITANLLTTASAAVTYVIEGVTDNARDYGYDTWNSAEDAVDLYVDDINAALGEGVSRKEVVGRVDVWLNKMQRAERAMKGGDEFIAIAKDLSDEDLFDLVERIITLPSHADADCDSCDLVQVLNDGTLVMWGADRSEGGRELILTDDAGIEGKVLFRGTPVRPSDDE